VIGAGIGGLTTALALQKHGFSVSVFEQAPELGEIGAGLTLFKNANIAFDYLGLNQVIASRSDIPNFAALKDYKTGEVLNTTKPLRTAADTVDGEAWKNTEFNLRQIHRADLHAILVESVLAKDPHAIHLGHAFRGLIQDKDSITAEFENGATAAGHVLIGCDGIRSAVRQNLYGSDDPEFLNYVAWRGLVPITSLPDDLITPDTGVLRGQNKSFTRYKIRDGSLVNYVAFARRDDWTADGWTVPSTVEEVLDEFEDAADEVRLLVTNTPPNTCFKWGLLGRDPLPKWTSGRATLLGDAAHPMLPFLGQGAGMAIEDAIVLARAFEASQDIFEGLERYEAARRERTTLVTQGARHSGLKMHGIHDDKTEQIAREYNQETVAMYDPVTVHV
jgi:salicylate hydroxylase